MTWSSSTRSIVPLSIQIVTAGVVAYLVCIGLRLQQPQWAVFSAIIVIQASVGASLQAMSDRLVGSIGGAIWGVVVTGLVSPDLNPIGIAIALAAAIAPLAVLAAWKPGYRVAPLTATILLLSPSVQGSPWALGLERVLVIGLGSVVALAVSLVILPVRARATMAAAAADALEAMAQLTLALGNGLSDQGSETDVLAAQDKIRSAIGRAEAAAVEVDEERAAYLSGGLDPGPLCRTLRRLRYDLSMAARAASRSLPDEALIVTTATSGLTTALAAYLESAGAALVGTEPAPVPNEIDNGFSSVAAAMAKLRTSGITRTLPDEVTDRVFGLAFAWEQIERDLTDLAERIDEMSRSSSR